MKKAKSEPAVAIAKKPATKSKVKKRAPRKPVMTDAMGEAWLMKRTETQFKELVTRWNEDKLKVKLVMQPNYDAWFNYFKTLVPAKIRLLAKTGINIIPTEGYAALTRWHDIISNPGKIDKIHRSGLTTSSETETIVDKAKKNDRLGVLIAIRDQLALKIQQGSGARDTGELSKNMMEVMIQIEIQERKQAPTPETELGRLMSDIPEISNKRPSKNGSGARRTSFASRVTIKDVEESTVDNG